jgi:hypothetical protein
MLFFLRAPPETGQISINPPRCAYVPIGLGACRDAWRRSITPIHHILWGLPRPTVAYLGGVEPREALGNRKRKSPARVEPERGEGEPNARRAKVSGRSIVGTTETTAPFQRSAPEAFG